MWFHRKAGIDAAKLTWLTVRMYFSAAADRLDIYYKSTDGSGMSSA